MASRQFKGEIRVASRVVDYLSSGLYETPAACVKELVNNSYDADASTTEIFVRPDADRIIVADDGEGMSREEFETHFQLIAESTKRARGETTASGRRKVGRIGIGFIAANELCDVMEIVSTKAGSTELLRVEIDFRTMREDPEKRRRSKTQFAKGDYAGQIDTAARNEHYTHVFLREVRGPAREVLAGGSQADRKQVGPSLYGLKPETIAQQLRRVGSWSDFDLYSQTMLQVGLNVPVAYAPGWIPSDVKNTVADFQRKAKSREFQLFYDGTEVLKPIVFGDRERHLVRRFEFEGKEVSASGYFFAQGSALRPQELNGVLIRIRDAAVGSYDNRFLGYPISRGKLFQSWISAEIWADDRLEDAMNIDRRTLRVTEPAFVELQRAFHARLAEVISDVRREIYEQRRDERAQARDLSGVRSIDEALEQSAPQLGHRTRSEITSAWSTAIREDKGTKRRRFRPYSPDEIYEIALEVAGEYLPPAELRRFAQELTSRLLEP